MRMRCSAFGSRRSVRRADRRAMSGVDVDALAPTPPTRPAKVWEATTTAEGLGHLVQRPGDRRPAGRRPRPAEVGVALAWIRGRAVDGRIVDLGVILGGFAGVEPRSVRWSVQLSGGLLVGPGVAVEVGLR